MIRIAGYDPNRIPIVFLQCNNYWQEINVLDLDNVHPNAIINAAFQEWRSTTEEDLDPESPTYFFAPSPEPEPLPQEADWAGFNQSVQPDPDFQAYMFSIPDALNKPLMILLMALNNQGFSENNYNVEQAVSAWNLIVASYPISEALLTKISGYAQQFNIPFTFAQDGTVGVSQ